MQEPRLDKQEIYRKLLHLSSLWTVLLIALFSRTFCLNVLGALTLVLLLTELLRKRWVSFAQFYNRFIGFMLRKHEQEGSFTGAFYLILSAFLGVFFFSQSIAMLSLAIALISDSLAALVGKHYGRKKLFDKSWAGSITFFLSTTALLLLFQSLSLGTTLLIAFAITLVELFSNKVKMDDNLSITLSSGILLTLLTL